jgi:hypothetical protein
LRAHARFARNLTALLAQVIGPDKHGIKTVIEFKVKEDGSKVREASGCLALGPARAAAAGAR